MSKKIKMNTKKTLVSFLLIASVLFLAATVSASNDLTVAASDKVEIDDVTVYGTGAQTLAVVAGNSIQVKIKFTVGDLGVDENGDNITSTSDLKVRVELEGNSDSIIEVSPLFDVEEGKTYVKTMTLEVPSDFDDDELSNNLALNVKIWNSDYKNDDMNVELRVQKVSYDLAIKSVIISNFIESGQSVPVDIVLKNVGYNDAKDIFVTVSIPELGVEKKGYFGDLVSVEDETNDDDDEDNVASGRFYVEIPYTAKSGEYELTIKAENDETSSKLTKAITIENSVSDLVIKSGSDELLVINPTNKMRVYTLVYESNEVTVVLPPASTKAVQIDLPEEGNYKFSVTVLSGKTVLDTVEFEGVGKSANVTSPVFVLTVILGIVFLVLVVVLVVLLTKKPQKTEEFGESYY